MKRPTKEANGKANEEANEEAGPGVFMALLYEDELGACVRPSMKKLSRALCGARPYLEEERHGHSCSAGA